MLQLNAYQYTEWTMNPIIFSLTVFLAGILFFLFSLCFLLLPVYIGILLGSDQEKAINCSGKNSLAWLGWKPYVLLLVFLLFSSSLVLERLAWKDHVQLIGSVIWWDPHHYPMVFIRWKSFTFISLRSKTMDFGANKQKNELFSAFLLGLGFSFGWTPCIGSLYWDQFLL